MSMADATKECKLKIKETFGIEFSDESSEDINIESEGNTEDDDEQEVDLADAERRMKNILNGVKLFPHKKKSSLNFSLQDRLLN